MKSRPRKIKRVEVVADCFFCVNKKTPDYKEWKELSAFISDRSKIKPTLMTGICSRHQRVLSREIKRARFLALLPYVENA